MAKGTEVTPLVKQKLAALDRAFTRAVQEHARTGTPVVLWENGRVVEAAPGELLQGSADEECVGDSKRPA
jgi:hypothetical protein